MSRAIPPRVFAHPVGCEVSFILSLPWDQEECVSLVAPGSLFRKLPVPAHCFPTVPRVSPGHCHLCRCTGNLSAFSSRLIAACIWSCLLSAVAQVLRRGLTGQDVEVTEHFFHKSPAADILPNASLSASPPK